jgi:hypothetical protein
MALCWGVLFFAGLQLGLIILMERWRPEVRDPESGSKWTRLKERMAAEPDRPLLLVLGTSLTELGFCPELLPPYRLKGGTSPLVFNYGITGTFPIQDLATLRSLLRAGIRPRWLLLEILPGQFGIGETSVEAFGKLPRTAWSDLPVLERYCPQRWRLYLNWFQARLAPWFSHRFSFLNQFAPDWLPVANCSTCWQDKMDRSGWFWWTARVTPDEYRKGLEATRREYSWVLADLHITNLPDQVTREVLNLCRKEGIAVALFLMPEESEFRRWYSPASNTTVNEYIARLTREYQVPVIDARQWIADGEFLDGHHLLPRGAALFTERFGREAIKPLLEGGRKARSVRPQK